MGKSRSIKQSYYTGLIVNYLEKRRVEVLYIPFMCTNILIIRVLFFPCVVRNPNANFDTKELNMLH